jgi:hypothetical protein
VAVRVLLALMFSAEMTGKLIELSPNSLAYEACRNHPKLYQFECFVDALEHILLLLAVGVGV